MPSAEPLFSFVTLLVFLKCFVATKVFNWLVMLCALVFYSHTLFWNKNVKVLPSKPLRRRMLLYLKIGKRMFDFVIELRFCYPPFANVWNTKLLTNSVFCFARDVSGKFCSSLVVAERVGLYRYLLCQKVSIGTSDSDLIPILIAAFCPFSDVVDSRCIPQRFK